MCVYIAEKQAIKITVEKRDSCCTPFIRVGFPCILWEGRRRNKKNKRKGNNNKTQKVVGLFLFPLFMMRLSRCFERMKEYTLFLSSLKFFFPLCLFYSGLGWWWWYAPWNCINYQTIHFYSLYYSYYYYYGLYIYIGMYTIHTRYFDYPPRWFFFHHVFTMFLALHSTLRNNIIIR